MGVLDLAQKVGSAHLVVEFSKSFLKTIAFIPKLLLLLSHFILFLFGISYHLEFCLLFADFIAIT